MDQKEREAQAFLREKIYNSVLALEDAIGQHDWSRRQTQGDAGAIAAVRKRLVEIGNQLYHARHGIRDLLTQWEEYGRGTTSQIAEMEAVTSGMVACPNHSFRVFYDEGRPCPICALQASVLKAKSHRADLAYAATYLLEQRGDDEDPDWDGAWQWMENAMTCLPNGWAESMVERQRDRLAGAVQELLDALASEFGSDDTASWPSVLQDAGDDAIQVLDGVRGAMRRTRQQFCDLAVGQAFFVSSVTFGTLGYEKIELQLVMSEGRAVNARLIRAETVGVLDDFALYEGDEFVEVERSPELELEVDDEGD